MQKLSVQSASHPLPAASAAEKLRPHTVPSTEPPEAPLLLLGRKLSSSVLVHTLSRLN